MDSFIRITEQSSKYRHLEKMPIGELLANMNNEDKAVPFAIEKVIPDIEKLVNAISDKMLAGGRLFYIGAGTSGRLAVVDASECPPTFGVPATLVTGIIAGGKKAMTQPVENAEDNLEKGWLDLKKHDITDADVVIGLTASGTTPYVIAALKKCRENNITTGSLACNPGSPVSAEAD